MRSPVSKRAWWMLSAVIATNSGSEPFILSQRENVPSYLSQIMILSKIGLYKFLPKYINLFLRNTETKTNLSP